MKWHFKALYVKALYVMIVLGSLVATAASGVKWH